MLCIQRYSRGSLSARESSQPRWLCFECILIVTVESVLLDDLSFISSMVLHIGASNHSLSLRILPHISHTIASLHRVLLLQWVGSSALQGLWYLPFGWLWSFDTEGLQAGSGTIWGWPIEQGTNCACTWKHIKRWRWSCLGEEGWGDRCSRHLSVTGLDPSYPGQASWEAFLNLNY